MKHSGNQRAAGWFRRFAAPLTVLCILLLLALNIGFALLSEYKQLYVDLTPEGLYTMSEAMETECAKVEEEITVTFCEDPDRLLSRFSTRYIYVMALALSNRFDNIRVETCNITLNPTAVDRFRTTSASSISETNVIVSCGDRYRIYSAESFWLSDEDAEDGEYWSFNGEYTMATAFFSLASVSRPVAYFTYGHGENYYVSETDTEHAELLSGSSDDQAAFYDLLVKEGLTVNYLDLSAVEKIPDDCALLIINGPSTDLDGGDLYSYYDTPDAEKLDRYISRGNGSVMIFKDPDYTLPNLEEFAEKWGISYVDGSIVKDAVRSLADATGTDASAYNSKLICDYTSDTSTISYGVYSDLVAIDSSPRVIADRTGSVKLAWKTADINLSGNSSAQCWYSDFLLSSENARTYTIDGNYLSGETAAYPVAALTTRSWSDSYSLEHYYSYVFGAATTTLTSNLYLTNASYANYDILFALVRYISRIDSYADMDLGGSSFNSANVGGKQLQYSALEDTDHTDYVLMRDYPAFTQSSLIMWSILILCIPVVVIPAIGIFVCVRRRHL